MSLEGILDEIKEKNLLAVRFEQTTTTGVAKSKTVNASRFKDFASKGINFVLCHLALDTSAGIAPGSGYTEEVGYRDGVAFPDLETFRVLPWVERVGRILIEPTDQGELVLAHPRVVARRQLEKLKSLGISLLSAHEHEFYLVHKETLKPVNEDINAHATIRNANVNWFFQKILEYLPEVGISIEHLMTEYGPGQLEITYAPAFGIRAADNAHTYKTSIKEIALLNGYIASFMSRPYPDKDGCSSHFCHSLWDVEGKVPLLYDPNSPLKLSELGQHWIAGILAHAPAIEVLMGPTVNCFKRVQPGIFTPVNNTWGTDNRTSLLRVKINGERGTYFENRAGASACNPYLSLSATVAAGMDGIVNKLALPPECLGECSDPDRVPPGTKNLPNNLEDALKELKDDKVICDALGADFIKCFCALKEHEVKLAKEAAEAGDTDWEFNHYFFYS